MSTRKIKNAVNNTTGELIYFKGHAQATYMSDGSTVEDAIKNIKPDLSDYVKSEELEGYAKTSDIPSLEGYAKTEDIPSLDGYAKTEDIPSVNDFVKSEDLPNFDEFAKTEDIPSLDGYASKEWVNNRNYATEYDLKTIDYSTINNVPLSEDETGELNITDESGNIGMKVASEAVYAKDFVAGEHKLSEKVDKTYVDNSIAETVTGVRINGITNNPSSGIVDLGYIHKQLSTSTSSSMTLSPNIYYRNTSTSLSTLTITLGSVSNSNIINEYFVEFTTSSSGTTITLPSTIKWANGETPTFEASTTYQISIVNNLGIVTKFK